MITEQTHFESGYGQSNAGNYLRKTYTTISTNIHIALRYSMYLAASYVLIFLIARLTGLAYHTEYRFVNYFICFPLSFAAVRHAFKVNNNYLEYFNGLIIGFLTVIMAQLWYAIVFFIYLLFDNGFLQYLITQLPSPLYYPRGSIFFTLMIEGLGAGSIISLTMMQYFKWSKGRWAFGR